jgi:hypothetical protein
VWCGGSRKITTSIEDIEMEHGPSMERTALEKGFAKSMGIYFQDSL